MTATQICRQPTTGTEVQRACEVNPRKDGQSGRRQTAAGFAESRVEEGRQKVTGNKRKGSSEMG